MELKILLVDDHRIMLEGLCALLERDKGLKVIATASNGREAIRKAGELKPDLVIMDLSMPDLNGIEATRQILANNSATKVIALTIHADTRYALEMIKAGARGYILKQCAYEEISRAIHSVAAGQAYLSPGVTQGLMRDFVNLAGGTSESAYSALSAREREVLQLLAEGKATKVIATQLNISVKTVETHKQNIMRKVGLRSLADLVRYAIREGLVSL